MDSLKAHVEEMLYNNEDDFKIAKLLKKDIKEYLAGLHEAFKSSGGKDFLVKHTRKIDDLLKLVYKIALRDMFGDYAPLKNNIPVTLIALGSYGREQLCVHSDIDLMIVYEDVPGYNHEAFIEKILYILWDTGLKLGHRVHDIKELFEVSKTDITIKTAIIESRFIEGSNFVWTKTQNAIRHIRHHEIESFITEKLTEQKAKHKQYPLTMEPHLKEGVGGFRDANLIYWIGKVLYNVDSIKQISDDFISDKEYREFRIALEFLFRVRSALHLAAGKKEDRLRLDLIPAVSQLVGYEDKPDKQMKFSRKVTQSLKTIRLYSTIWLDILTRKFQPIKREIPYLYPLDQEYNFLSILEFIDQAAEQPFRAHPTLLQILIHTEKPDRMTKAINKAIFQLFYRPHLFYVLKTFAYVKHLKTLIPPMSHVIGLPQFDGYHTFAVDIHSMECVKHLESIKDPFVLSLYESFSVDEKAMIKMVTLLHDAGKGRKKDHHQVGASLFKVFAKKLGMKAELIEMGDTLILYHTLMSKVAQREDLHNNNVILKFASHFKTKKMLDLIYVLTYADMSGVGKDIYNSFSAKLIHTLYYRALETLDKEHLLDETAKRVKKEAMIRRHPHFKALKKTEQNKIMNIPSNLLFLNMNTETIISLAQEIFDLNSYKFYLNNREHFSIEIFKKPPLHLGFLLSKLGQLDIRQMDIYKLSEDIKYFHISFSGKVHDEDIEEISHIIHESFKDRAPKLMKPPHIKHEEIHIDCDHSEEYAVMYLNCANQQGLLAYVTNMLEIHGVDVVTAKIHTIKNRAKDMFLIEKNGNFCHNVKNFIKQLTGT